jgi:hypothetical protein
VEILLMNGVDPDVKTGWGQTIIDLCEDGEVKQEIIEIIDAIKNKRPQPVRGDTGYGTLSRRTSSARRSSIVSPASVAWQRRSSLHEHRDSICLREIREEAEKLREMILHSKDNDDDDEQIGASDGPSTSPIVAASGSDADVDSFNKRQSGGSDNRLAKKTVSNCSDTTEQVPTLSETPQISGNIHHSPVTVTKSIMKKTNSSAVVETTVGNINNGSSNSKVNSEHNVVPRRHNKLCCVVV